MGPAKGGRKKQEERGGKDRKNPGRAEKKDIHTAKATCENHVLG